MEGCGLGHWRRLFGGGEEDIDDGELLVEVYEDEAVGTGIGGREGEGAGMSGFFAPGEGTAITGGVVGGNVVVAISKIIYQKHVVIIGTALSVPLDKAAGIIAIPGHVKHHIARRFNHHQGSAPNDLHGFVSTWKSIFDHIFITAQRHRVTGTAPALGVVASKYCNGGWFWREGEGG
jgi:hypothetical protein